MQAPFLETGEIVNTHGLRGEVKILPWADSPAFLLQFKTLYVGGAPLAVEQARVQGSCVLVKFRGVDDVNAAQRLRGKTVSFARADAEIPEGMVFIADLVGLPVLADGREIGKLAEVLQTNANDVYVVRGGEHEYMIPAVPAFLEEVNPEGGVIRVRLLEGMETDAH